MGKSTLILNSRTGRFQKQWSLWFKNHMLTTFQLCALNAPLLFGALTDFSQISGGIGRNLLSNFYRDHFIFNNPQELRWRLSAVQ
jgi:hypothetical protein